MANLSGLIVVLYGLLLLALALYGMHRLEIVRLYRLHLCDTPRPRSPEARPLVTVQLPIFNERNVVERLIAAAAALDWPRDQLEVQVLDDSTDDTWAVTEACAARARARGLDISVIHRADRRGYKAGALEAGMRVAKGALIAIFDADFLPPRDFLRRVVPYFDLDQPLTPGGSTGRVGMVQARWGHLNERANLLTRLASVLLDGHFVLEHTARNRSGRFFNFNGTAGVWRRACIADAGGWQHDTVTEDLDLSYRAQLQGWRFVYLKDVVVPAELPSTMRAYRNQQHRWAKGAIQTARKLIRPILRSELPAAVKREAVIHLTTNLAYPLVVLLALGMPLAMAARGRTFGPISLVLDLGVFALSLGSIACFYGITLAETGPGWRRRLWRLPGVLALGVGLSVSQTRAVLEGLLGSDATFVRTPKLGDERIARRIYAPNFGWTPFVALALAAYLLAAMVWAATAGLWLSLPWMALFFAGFAYVGVASLLPNRRPSPRLEERAPEVVEERAAS